MLISRWLLILSLLFTANSYADETDVKVYIGFGKVEIKVDDESKLSIEQKEKIENLETQLTIDEDLANLVTDDELRSIEIEINSVDGDELEKTNIKATIQGQLKVDTPANAEVIYDGDSRVVMGSSLVVEEGDVLEELVVVGGTAEIKGRVKELVVVGGHVHLLPTAVIERELNIIGGTVKTEPGAEIHGKRTNIGVPLSEERWEAFIDELFAKHILRFFDQSWVKLIIALIKVITLLVFAFIGFYAAPNYQRKVSEYFSQRWGMSLLWGFISLALIVPTTMVLLFSVIGMPLMPLQFSLYFLFFIYGYIHCSWYIGSFLLNQVNVKVQLNSSEVWKGLVVGLLFLELINFIPYLGPMLKWVVIFAGFGAASKVFYTMVLTPPSQKTV